MPEELLIKGGYVVTMDPDLGDLPAGDVLMADGVITAVGKDLRPATAEAEGMDAAEDEARVILRARRHVPYASEDNFAIIAPTSISTIKIPVILDEPNVATSSTPLGTVFGTQLSGENSFQVPLMGVVDQVALPA